MRGDGESDDSQVVVLPGSPPHARGRLSTVCGPQTRSGITPACAGTAPPWSASPSRRRDHPRMRGDGIRRVDQQPASPGSPPHARGRRRGPQRHLLIPGITPACAGTAPPGPRPWCGRWDHPRMRGDGQAHAGGASPLGGITPACAGTALHHRASSRRARDHPRMRGDGFQLDAVVPGIVGITPACAGTALLGPGDGLGGGDHPRMRGDGLLARRRDRWPRGSPPHARGRPTPWPRT